MLVVGVAGFLKVEEGEIKLIMLIALNIVKTVRKLIISMAMQLCLIKN